MKRTLLVCALMSLGNTSVAAEVLQSDECPVKVQGEITPELVIRVISTTESTCAKQARIKLLVASNGGGLNGSYMLYNFLMNWPGGVDTHGEHVESAAVLLYLSGIRRTMSATGSLLVHKPFRTLDSGDYNEADMMEMGNSLKNDRIKMTAIITKHTGLSRNEVEEMFHQSAVLTPEEAIAKGFVHKIVPLAR